jgi:hypothetical protein
VNESFRVRQLLKAAGQDVTIRESDPVAAIRQRARRRLFTVKRFALVVVLIFGGVVVAAVAASGRPQGNERAAGSRSPTTARGHRATRHQAIRTHAPGSTVALSGMAGVIAGGASTGSSRDWLLGKTALAVSHDAGQSWTLLPLPASSEDLGDVSVLPTETVAVSGGGTNVVAIYSLDVGQTAWSTQDVSLTFPVGGLEIVDAGTALQGIMVTEESSAQFSSGAWLYTPDGGSTWQVLAAPAGGVASEVGGALWLVGGPTNSSVYESYNDGTTWKDVTSSLGVASPQSVAFSPVEADGAHAIVTATESTTGGSAALQVLQGSLDGSAWTWTDGPDVRLAGSYGSGAAPAVAVGGDMLWVGGVSLEIVNLSNGEVSQAELPAGTSSLYPASATSALAVYSSTTCAQGKTGCSQANGLADTSDGGTAWSDVVDPFSS